MAEDAALRGVLAAGDVDELRRLLKHGTMESSESSSPTVPERPVITATATSRNLFTDRPLLQLGITPSMTLKVRSFRTMGKLCWPAGHAVALMIAKRSSCPTPVRPFAMLEVGAGTGIPSLAAAAGGAFSLGVVATDCFDDNIQLLRHNDRLNGERLHTVERIDVGESGALRALVGEKFPEADLLLVACEMSYDPEAMTNLFASAAEVSAALPSVRLLFLFARSDGFAHLDDHQHAVGNAHGFEVLTEIEVHASGMLDAVAESYFTPCAENRVKLFFWVRQESALPLPPSEEQKKPDLSRHPIAAWLLDTDHPGEMHIEMQKIHKHSEERDASESVELDLWAPKQAPPLL
jgi:predicted nicotinamide N-methyase